MVERIILTRGHGEFQTKRPHLITFYVGNTSYGWHFRASVNAIVYSLQWGAIDYATGPGLVIGHQDDWPGRTRDIVLNP